MIKEKKSRTIMRRVLLPVIIAFCLQIALFLGILISAGTFGVLRTNGYNVFDEWTSHTASNIQNYMTNTWSNIQETENRVNADVETALAENNKTYADISRPFADDEKGQGRNKHINEKILETVADDILYMLRKNSVTHAFIALDGPGTQNQSEEFYKGGILLFDRDPSATTTDNSDVEMMIGTKTIRDMLGITQNNSDTVFGFSKDGAGADEGFFFGPIREARATGDKYAYAAGFSQYYALWTFMPERGRLFYSRPLVSADGDIYGVLGIGLTTDYISGLFDLKSKSYSDNGAALCIVKKDENGEPNELTSIAFQGALIQNLFGANDGLGLRQSDFENAYTVEQDERLIVSVNELALYSRNSPFEGTTWAVAGFIKSSDVFYVYNFVILVIVISVAASILVGVFAVTLSVYRIVRPVRNIADEVENFSFSEGHSLSKTNIREIDMLANAFVDKSIVAETVANKISGIISSADMQIGVFEYERGGNKVFVSRSLYPLMGWKDKPNDYIESERFLQLMPRDMLRSSDSDDEVVYQLKKQNRWVQISFMDDGNKIIGVVHDVTKETLEKRRMEYERDFDVLTGIHNRRYFIEQSYRLFADPKNMKCTCMVVYDLDDLKFVNDTYGHDFGDKYIQLMANALKSFPKDNALVARMSGDEFSVLLYDFDCYGQIEAAIAETASVIKKSVMPLPNGGSVALRASGGYAYYPDDADSIEELSKYADFAMYSVKREDKGSVARFDKHTYINSEQNLKQQNEFYDIIENRRFRYAFQPIVEVKTGAVFAYEMLMRPQGKTLVSPSQILEFARRTAKLRYIEYLTWFESLGAFYNRVDEGKIPEGTKAFVNSLNDCMMTEGEVEDLERRYAGRLDNVVLEIMENAPVTSAPVLEYKLAVVARWNGQVAIDDYGSAYNGDAVLSMADPNYVKVDISVISGIDHDYPKQTAFANIVKNMRDRDIKVIAEGVETEEEMRTLVMLGADYLQGFWIGRPDTDNFGIPPEITRKILDAVSSASFSSPLYLHGKETEKCRDGISRTTAGPADLKGGSK